MWEVHECFSTIFYNSLIFYFYDTEFEKIINTAKIKMVWSIKITSAFCNLFVKIAFLFALLVGIKHAKIALTVDPGPVFGKN